MQKRKILKALIHNRYKKSYTKISENIDITKKVLYYSCMTCNLTATDERRTPMQTEKKTFTEAEVEVIVFDSKDDIVTLSGGGEGMIDE